MIEGSSNTAPDGRELVLRARANERYRAMSVLSEYMPIVMANGAIVRNLVCECSQCKGPVARGMMRGEVREVPGDRFRITAIGWCLDCDMLTPYLFHLAPEGETGFGIEQLEFRGWPERYENKLLHLPTPGLIEAKEPVSNTG